MPFHGALDNLNSPHIAREKFDYEFLPRYYNIIPFLSNNMMNFAEISGTRMKRKLEKKNCQTISTRQTTRVVTETTRFVSIKRDAFVSDRNEITAVFLSSSRRLMSTSVRHPIGTLSLSFGASRYESSAQRNVTVSESSPYAFV